MASAFDPFATERPPRPDGLEERVRQHRAALRACARRILGDDEQAEAVVGEVLDAAPHALSLFRPTGSLGCWLQGVTVGVALARLRGGPPRRGPLRARAARSD